MRTRQNISNYTWVNLSVHVWNHDLIWWQNKIDTLKTFPQEYDYELLNPKWNENSHYKSKGADGVKHISEVPRSEMMMTPSYGSFFRVTDPLCAEFPSHRASNMDFYSSLMWVRIIC